jgi:Uma2 family endonuclease
MATAATTSIAPAPIVHPGARLLTIADVLALPTELPSGPVDYELNNGCLVPMSPPGRRHGELHASLGVALHIQGQQQGHGKVFVETGVVLWRNPDRMVGPDISFVASRSLPVRDSAEGFLETIPELVVEIRSKNDRQAEIDQKVADYLKAGVELIWNVDPATETVVEHRPKTEPRTLGKADTLECEEIIPGFRLALAELFQQ